MKDKILFCILSISLLSIVAIAYANHFNNSFQFDDSHTIESNISIRDINIKKFFSDPSTFSVLPANQVYRPLFVTILALEYWAGAGKPLWFHLGAFSCYLMLGVLLFMFFKQIFSIARPQKNYSIAALLATFFFLVHTANAETVNYVSAGSDLFSTTFMLAALVIYAQWPGLRKFGLYIIFAAMAMLVKEVSVIFPVFLLIYILYEKKYASKMRAFLAIIPVTLVCGALLILSSTIIPDTFVPSAFTRLEYILTQPFVIVHYFNSFLLPFNLSADTDWKTIGNIFDDRVLIGFSFICLLIFLSNYTWKKYELRPIGLGILFFLCGVFPPCSGIVILAEVMNDHRMFLPFVGLTLAAAWILILFFEKYSNIFILKISYVVVLGSIFALHAYGTRQRNIVWNTPSSLWYDVTIKSPNNGRGLMNYGLCLMEKGLFKEALGYFERALVFTPYYEHLHINVAIALDNLGDMAKAEIYFANALRYNAKYYGSYYFYARFLEKHNRPNEALKFLNTAVALAPNFLASRHLIMKIHDKNHDINALRQAVNDTLKRWPDEAIAQSYYNKIQ